MMIFYSLSSFSRDDVEKLLSIGPKIISQNHHGVEEFRLIILYSDEVIETSKHILILVEYSFDKEFGKKPQNKPFLVEFFVARLNSREISTRRWCLIGLNGLPDHKRIEILVNFVQLTTNFNDEFLGFWVYIALSNTLGHPINILSKINYLDFV